MLGGGIGSCLSWSLMADAIDYNEWKFGVREEGTTYALHSFFRKLAQGIGPSLGLVLATKLGYDASLKAAQTIEVATRMRYLVPVMYLGSYIVMIIAYGVVFNLDKKDPGADGKRSERTPGKERKVNDLIIRGIEERGNF